MRHVGKRSVKLPSCGGGIRQKLGKISVIGRLEMTLEKDPIVRSDVLA